MVTAALLPVPSPAPSSVKMECDTPSSPLPLLEERTQIHHQGHFLAELPVHSLLHCPSVASSLSKINCLFPWAFQWSPLYPTCTTIAKRNLDQNSSQGITPIIKQVPINIDLGLAKMFFSDRSGNEVFGLIILFLQLVITCHRCIRHIFKEAEWNYPFVIYFFLFLPSEAFSALLCLALCSKMSNSMY